MTGRVNSLHFLFILASGVFGVFVAQDLFMLFFFYEIAVFPMYLLISIWGWIKTREYAAMKLTLYLFIGSVISLVGGLALYFGSGLNTFDMIQLATGQFFQGFPDILVPVCILWLCGAGRYIPIPQLEPGWSRGSTDGSFHVPRRCADEARCICCSAGGDHAAARRSTVLALADHDPGTGQCGLWCLYRHGPD